MSQRERDVEDALMRSWLDMNIDAALKSSKL